MFDLPERVKPVTASLVTGGSQRESPWAAVSLGATLQAVAHLLYLGSLLLFFMLGFMTLVDRQNQEMRGAVTVILVVGGLAFCVNFVLSLVAGAVLASADVGARARGIGAALLACSLVVLLRLGSLGLDMQLMDRGVINGPANSFAAGSGMLLFGMLEIARLSLVGFYISSAAWAGRKPGLSSSGQLLGVLSPVIQAALCVLSFGGMMMSGPKAFGELAGPALMAVNGGAMVLLLLFGAMLMFQLRGVADRLAEERQEDN
jgi:hypothetical protein